MVSQGRIGNRPAPGGASSPPPAPSRILTSRNHTCAHTHTHTRAYPPGAADQPWPRDRPGLRSENADFLLRSPRGSGFWPRGAIGFSCAVFPFLPLMLLTASPPSPLSTALSPGPARGPSLGPGVDAVGPQCPALPAPERGWRLQALLGSSQSLAPQ